MTRLASLVVTAVTMLSFSLVKPAVAEVPVDEAQKKLDEKAKQKEAERGKEVAITQGELDDLKAQIAALKAENARLRGDTAAKGSAAAPRHFDNIELGMSKQEVLDFVKQHKEYKLVGISADSGVHKFTSEQTTRVQSNSSGQSNTKTTIDDQVQGETNGSPRDAKAQGTFNRKVEGTASREGTTSVEVEHVSKAGQRETITIEKGKWVKVAVGSHTEGVLNSRQTFTDYADRYQATSTMRISMTDGVVTAMDGGTR